MVLSGELLILKASQNLFIALTNTVHISFQNAEEYSPRSKKKFHKLSPPGKRHSKIYLTLELLGDTLVGR